MEKPLLRNKAACISAAVLLAAAFGLGGFFLGRNTPSAPKAGADDRALRIHVTTDRNRFVSLPLGPEGGNYEGVTCLGVRDVTVELDGRPTPLEDALREGTLTVDQMVFYARQDAQNGLCQETAVSKNGLATFTYRYPYHNFNMAYIYDIYETPDGKQHLITKCEIYGSGSDPSVSHPEDEEGRPIDYEDWGLEFGVSQADASGVILNCTQSGGQQAGELVIEGYFLCRRDGDAEETVEPLTESILGETVPIIPLTMDGETEISLDLSSRYGQLPPGDYALYLHIRDQYTELPPLMRKYHTKQYYFVYFTVEK